MYLLKKGWIWVVPTQFIVSHHTRAEVSLQEYEFGENYYHYILSHVKTKTHSERVNSLGQTHSAGKVISTVGHSSTTQCKIREENNYS